MSKQHFATDSEKHIVLGPAMIPDQKIFRRDEKTGENYSNVQFNVKDNLSKDGRYLSVPDNVILEIKDLRIDKRIDFVGGIRGLGELKKRVDSGEMKAAFALYPVSMKQLIDIADSGNIMPPKTTWFEPKLRSGLVVHVLD